MEGQKMEKIFSLIVKLCNVTQLENSKTVASQVWEVEAMGTCTLMIEK
jgi:hypothetical protein